MKWAQEILAKSPTSIKMLKFAMNLTDDGMVGQQVFAGVSHPTGPTSTEEAKEGRNAFLEKENPISTKNGCRKKQAVFSLQCSVEQHAGFKILKEFKFLVCSILLET